MYSHDTTCNYPTINMDRINIRKNVIVKLKYMSIFPEEHFIRLKYYTSLIVKGLK